MQLIGDLVAIRWPDGLERYLSGEYLRENSPSADTMGERDIFGNQLGGDGGRRYPGVTVTGWTPVGNYAVAFLFSDGHRTGIYAWDYLRRLAEASPEA